MRERICGSKKILVVLVLFLTSWAYGQVITSGEISYTRRTNLEKRYKGNKRMAGQSKKWLQEPKVDKYTLYFDENASLFMPMPVIAGEEDREWTTTKTTTLTDLRKGTVERQFNFMGSEIYLNDTITKRDWIITGGTRDIAGYKTKQVMWIANDSTKIYAWYSEQIRPSVGPETYSGLPGAILGLAIEDGGVVYFAEKVTPLKLKDFRNKMPKGKDKNTYTKKSLYDFIISRFTKEDYGGRILDDILIW